VRVIFTCTEYTVYRVTTCVHTVCCTDMLTAHTDLVVAADLRTKVTPLSHGPSSSSAKPIGDHRGGGGCNSSRDISLCCGACLAVGHAGEAGLVHGAPHQVAARAVVAHVQLAVPSLRVLPTKTNKSVNVYKNFKDIVHCRSQAVNKF
jgi:hypothetical protein